MTSNQTAHCTALLQSMESYTPLNQNHGEVLSVSTRGDIKQVIDISASEGHIVPTSIAERDGSFYVGNLNLFPIDPQWAGYLRSRAADTRTLPYLASHKGLSHREFNSGFTTVVAVDFGPDGLIYALELSDQPGNPAPEVGKVLRVRSSGEIEDVVTGLSIPTGMTLGPGGALYVSNFGAAPAEAGQILRLPFSVARRPLSAKAPTVPDNFGTSLLTGIVRRVIEAKGTCREYREFAIGRRSKKGSKVAHGQRSK